MSTFTDEGLAYLSDLKELRWLIVGDCNITDKSLKIIADSFKNLQWLSLHGCPITGSDLVKLSMLEHLVSLGLIETRVTDQALKTIPNFKKRNLSAR
jgi:hypothetical protein